MARSPRRRTGTEPGRLHPRGHHREPVDGGGQPRRAPGHARHRPLRGSRRGAVRQGARQVGHRGRRRHDHRRPDRTRRPAGGRPGRRPHRQRHPTRVAGTAAKGHPLGETGGQGGWRGDDHHRCPCGHHQVRRGDRTQAHVGQGSGTRSRVGAAGVARRHRRVGLHLLLEPPVHARGPGHVGDPRGPPLERAVQPVDRAPPAGGRRARGVGSVRAPRPGRRPTRTSSARRGRSTCSTSTGSTPMRSGGCQRASSRCSTRRRTIGPITAGIRSTSIATTARS